MEALRKCGISEHAALGIIQRIPNTLAALLYDWIRAGRPHLRHSRTAASTAAFDMSLAYGWIDVRKITGGVVKHIAGVGKGSGTRRGVLWPMASYAEYSGSLPHQYTAPLIAATLPSIEREQAARQAAKQRWLVYLDSIAPMRAASQ
jgi:hypothetical protein